MARRTRAARPLATLALACVGLLMALLVPGSAQAADIDRSRSEKGVTSTTAAPAADVWCTHPYFGGRYLCGSGVELTLIDERVQFFAIGTDYAVHTRWEQGSGLSGWQSLGGQCGHPGFHSVNVPWVNPNNAWHFIIRCRGLSDGGKCWHNQRYASGNWSGWYLASDPYCYLNSAPQVAGTKRVSAAMR